MRLTPLALGASLLAGSVQPQTVAQSDSTIVIAHVSIVDVETGKTLPDRNVTIAGNRIVRIGPARTTPNPPNAIMIDGRGGFLIPGLWDMHVHTGKYADGMRTYPRALAVGITGIRDMGSPGLDIVRLRNDIRRGAMIGPRMVVAGPLLEAPLPFNIPLIVSVANAAEATAAVDSLADLGVDFIKVHDAPPREAYFAIAREAGRRGLPFAGHIPVDVTATEAAQANQASIEHLGGRFHAELLCVSNREPALREDIDRIAADALSAVRGGRDPDDAALFRAPMTRALAAGFDAARERALIAVFRKHHTWQTPTLVSQPLREAVSSQTSGLTPNDRREGAVVLRLQGRLVRDMNRGGVGILAGTDKPVGDGSLVTELGLLVEAGLTPLEALRAATINPARFLHATDSLGTVRVGNLADLVLLDANPLVEIRAVARVRAVLANGRRQGLAPGSRDAIRPARVSVKVQNIAGPTENVSR